MTRQVALEGDDGSQTSIDINGIRGSCRAGVVGIGGIKSTLSQRSLRLCVRRLTEKSSIDVNRLERL
jgi:hypothetical protein